MADGGVVAKRIFQEVPYVDLSCESGMLEHDFPLQYIYSSQYSDEKELCE
jgi:hypothetical protein